MQTVGTIMTKDVFTVQPEMSVRELAQHLSHRRISGAPVVDGQGNLVGVVSQTDLAAFASHSLPSERDPQAFYQGIWMSAPPDRAVLERMSSRATVADIMAPYVYFATEDTSLVEVADLMLKRSIHRTIVLREGVVVGIVSCLDVIRALRDQL
jgi:CBS domain-containing protein